MRHVKWEKNYDFFFFLIKIIARCGREMKGAVAGANSEISDFLSRTAKSFEIRFREKWFKAPKAKIKFPLPKFVQSQKKLFIKSLNVEWLVSIVYETLDMSDSLLTQYRRMTSSWISDGFTYTRRLTASTLTQSADNFNLTSTWTNSDNFDFWQRDDTSVESDYKKMTR